MYYINILEIQLRSVKYEQEIDTNKTVPKLEKCWVDAVNK